MKNKVIIVGDGGHAKVVIDIIEEENKYEIIGVTTAETETGLFCGYDILGNDDVLLSYKKKGINNVAIGIGGFKDNVLRTKIFTKLTDMGLNIINAIHPSAIISKTVTLGKGLVVFPNVTINTDAIIGNNIIIATNSSIDHETIIESDSLISAGVTIGAYSRICKGSLCAIGSTVVSGVNIGVNVLVAAGVVVVNSIESEKKVFGIPAKEKNKLL